MIKLFVILTAIFALFGCENSDISNVKSGTMELDKSLTLGQAIDNYKYFNSTEWELLTTENGRKVVQVTGDIDFKNMPNLSNAEVKSMFISFQFTVNTDDSFELSWCGVGVESVDGNIIDPEENANINQCIGSLSSIYDNSYDI